MILLGAAAALAGCSDFPQLEDTISEGARDAPYPQLVPVEGLEAQGNGFLIDAQTGAGLEARATRLRARAARLRRAVIDPATRARMARGVR